LTPQATHIGHLYYASRRASPALVVEALRYWNGS
jgi:hypothetical protein